MGNISKNVRAEIHKKRGGQSASAKMSMNRPRDSAGLIFRALTYVFQPINKHQSFELSKTINFDSLCELQFILNHDLFESENSNLNRVNNSIATNNVYTLDPGRK